MMTIALIRQVSPALNACELTCMDRAPIDTARAAVEHARYEGALREMGAEVISLPADRGLPDCAFIEDTALMLDGVAVIASMRRPSRAPEIDLSERLLATQRDIVRIEPPGFFEGGDAFLVEGTIYVGLSTRTNEAGVTALRRIAEPLGYRVIAVPVTGCLHLTTGASWLAGDRALANPQWIDSAPIAASGVEVIAVDPREPWSANTLRLGGATLMAEGFPRTREIVEGLGVTTRVTPIDEIQKAEAGLTCMSLLFEGDAAALRSVRADPASIPQRSTARA